MPTPPPARAPAPEQRAKPRLVNRIRERRHAELHAAAVRQFLIERHRTALRVVEFLVDQGLVASNQHAAFDRWLAGRLELLPAQIRAEVHTPGSRSCAAAAPGGPTPARRLVRPQVSRRRLCR